MAPAIAERMSPADRSAMDAVVQRGTLDLKEFVGRTGEDLKRARKRIDRLEQSGFLLGQQTKDGHEYWSPSELGYEIVRTLRSKEPRKTSNMETLNDWSFLASHDPQDPHQRKFRHPQTRNKMVFDSLSPQDQMMFKQVMQQQMMQPEGQPAVVDMGGADMGAPDMGDAGMGDAGMGGGDGGGDGGGMMAMNEEEIVERAETNTGQVDFGEAMAMEEYEARMGDYLGLEDMLEPSGLGFIPVSLGTRDDPDTQHEGPGLDQEGEHMADCIDPPMEIAQPDMDSWSFVADDEKEGAMQREMLLPVVTGRPGMMEEPPEPPPPAQVRRMLADRMRELGRGLMIAGSKAPRQQMLEIQRTMLGLMEQLEALSDQPGRESIRRRILLQLRPHVMRF